MTRHALTLGWLTVVWVVLWRDLSVSNVVSGLVLGAAVLALFPFRDHPPPLTLRPLPLLHFAAVFAWSVVKANAVIAWEVITPANRINEGVVAVHLTTDHPVVVTMVSHAIILAPGTMVIDIDHDASTVIYVHVLHLRSVEQVRRDVLRLEHLAAAAVIPHVPGPDPEVAP